MEHVLMPQMGISEESAVLTQWHVQKDGTVKKGDKLFSIETGKSAFDIESEHSGQVLALLCEEGDEIPVKAPVCIIGQAGESVPDAVAAHTPAADAPVPAATAPAANTAAPAAPAAAPATAAAALRQAIRGVSPRAKGLAARAGVDPMLALPTGPEGRVIERDIRTLMTTAENTVQAPPQIQAVGSAAETVPAPAFEDKPMSNLRKVIAKNMMASLQNTAQLTHTASFDASNILAYRALLKTIPETAGVTLTDMVLYAVTRTLPAFPSLNAHLMGDTLRIFSQVNLACAVDTEKGLMVPVIFGASDKTLLEISRELKTLAEACRNGSAAPGVLSGGSFTVSNLGQFGIESFTPILNAPQTGILGVNTITQRVRELNGSVAAYPCMSLSLTYDHRAVDGAPASKFLQTLCKNLENFTALLAR